MSKAFQGQSYPSFKIYILIKLHINVQYFAMQVLTYAKFIYPMQMVSKN